MWYWFRLTGKCSDDVNIQNFYEDLFEECDEYARCEELGKKTEGWHTHCLFKTHLEKKVIMNLVNDYGYSGNQCYTLKQVDDDEKNLKKILSYVLKEDVNPTISGETLESISEESRVLSKTSKGPKASELERFTEFIKGDQIPKRFNDAVRWYYKRYAEYCRGRFRDGDQLDPESGTRTGFRRNQVTMIIDSLLMDDSSHRQEVLKLLQDRNYDCN